MCSMYLLILLLRRLNICSSKSVALDVYNSLPFLRYMHARGKLIYPCDRIRKYDKFSGSSLFNKASSGEPAAKKAKTVYKVNFADSWTKIFPIDRVNANPHAFYCIPCKNSVSCAHMGINDVKEHCKGTIHEQNEEAIKMTRKISSVV